MKHDNLMKIKAALLGQLPTLLPHIELMPVHHGRAERAREGGLQLKLKTPSGRIQQLNVEMRVANAPSQILQAVRQLREAAAQGSKGHPVLASTFLSPRARAICREGGIGYLDLAGNSYLQFENFYFERSVDRNPFPHRGRPASVFSPISSRIVRALLEEPAREWRVAELATTARVSLGQTSNVCRRLIGEAYAEREGGHFHLIQPGKLLDAWRQIDMMGETQARAYYSFEQDPETLMRRVGELAGQHSLRSAMTSFAGASLIAPFVRGIGAVSWYVEGPEMVSRWVEALDLRPVESGPNVMLLIPYDAGVWYRTQMVDGVQVVGNVQLYVDLYQDPARGREQAEFLRQERLRF